MTSAYHMFTPPIAYYVSYLGSTVVEKKHTQTILPWMLCEMKRKGNTTQVMLEIRFPNLRTTLTDGTRDILFEYPVWSLSRVIQGKTEPKCFGFLHKETWKCSDKKTYTYHMFLAHNTKTVSWSKMQLFRVLQKHLPFFLVLSVGSCDGTCRPSVNSGICYPRKAPSQARKILATCSIYRVYFFPAIGGFPLFSHGFLTPLRSGQIWKKNRPMYRGVCHL